MQEQSKTFRITPAGRRFLQFIQAFNKPDRLHQFVIDHFGEGLPVGEFVEWCWQSYEETGGLEIYRSYNSEEYFVIVVVRALRGGKLYLSKLKTEATSPYRIIEYFHEPLNDNVV